MYLPRDMAIPDLIVLIHVLLGFIEIVQLLLVVIVYILRVLCEMHTGRTQSRLWMAARFPENITTPDNSTMPVTFPASQLLNSTSFIAMTSIMCV